MEHAWLERAREDRACIPAASPSWTGGRADGMAVGPADLALESFHGRIVSRAGLLRRLVKRAEVGDAGGLGPPLPPGCQGKGVEK